jgi:hypothetical protein
MVLLHLYTAALRDLLRVKRVVLGGILVLLPGALALLWRLRAPDDFDPVDIYHEMSSIVVYGFLLVIVSVVLGTGIIGQEMEQKTIVYLLTKPVARWKILLSKALAAATGTVIAAWSATALLALSVADTTQGTNSFQLRISDIRDSGSFLVKIRDDEGSIAKAVRSKLRPRTISALSRFSPPEEPSERLIARVVAAANQVIKSQSSLYREEDFAVITLSEAARKSLSAKSRVETVRSNRLIFDDYFAGEVNRYTPSSYNVWRDMAILPFGAMAYLSVFLLLGTVLNRPLMYGLLFAFGWERLAPGIPGNFQLVSIMSYLRVLSPHPKPPAESVEMMQFLMGGATSDIKVLTAWIVLAGVIAAGTLTSLYLFSTREFVPREDAE